MPIFSVQLLQAILLGSTKACRYLGSPITATFVGDILSDAGDLCVRWWSLAPAVWFEPVKVNNIMPYTIGCTLNPVVVLSQLLDHWIEWPNPWLMELPRLSRWNHWAEQPHWFTFLVWVPMHFPVIVVLLALKCLLLVMSNCALGALYLVSELGGILRLTCILVLWSTALSKHDVSGHSGFPA